MPQLRSLDKNRDFAAIERIWLDLSRQCVHSYFLSWPWIKNWVETLPSEANVRLAVVEDSAGPLAAFFLGYKRVFRHLFVRCNSLFINQTGIADADSLCIEYNSLLTRRDAAVSLAQLADLLGDEWEEIRIAHMDTSAERLEAITATKARVIIEHSVPSLFVDLTQVRVDGYLSLLSSNTRSQIRRSYRLYEEKHGPVRTCVARTISEAYAIYDELVRMHQAHWTEEGKPGAFASAYFDRFHRRLIETRMRSGDIQLLSVSAGSHTIGCLYNFVYRGRIYFYQSGIARQADNRLKPGYVCHTEAVGLNATLGHAEYDFLGGANRYKQTLATGARQLSSVVIQRPKLKFRVEEALRRVKRHSEAVFPHAQPAQSWNE